MEFLRKDTLIIGFSWLFDTRYSFSVSSKRPAHLLARCGGEEFGVILSETTESGAIAVAHEICAAIKHPAIVHERYTVSDIITISVGVATLVPSTQVTPEALVQLADQALYRAKAEGQNYYVPNHDH